MLEIVARLNTGIHSVSDGERYVTLLLAEPVHWYLHPRSDAASAMPYWVGTKKGLVVTWLTNTKFH